MTSLGPGRINAFIIGTDRALWWQYQNPANERSWTGFVRNAGLFAYEPVVVSRQLNFLTAFVVNIVDSSLQAAEFDLVQWGDFGPWKPLGGKAITPPAVANRKGTLHLFHIGVDRALYHKSWDGASYTPAEGFERLDGRFVHQPTAVSTGSEDVSVFSVGITDGSLHRYGWDSGSGWNPIQKLPGIWAGKPVAISDREGCWDVFGLGLNGQINQLSSKPGQQPVLKTISGVFKSVEAVSWGPGRIDLFAMGLNSSTYHKSWEHGSWGGWEDLKGVSVQPPKGVSHSPGALTVLIIGSDGKIWANIRDRTTGAWSGWFVSGPGVSVSRVG